MKKILIIDGHSIVFRVHFAQLSKPLINSRGINVTILQGFLTKLTNLLARYEPDFCAVVFDEKGPTFRNEMYPAYKANRDKAPDEVNLQTPMLKELLVKLGFKVFSRPGVEADDIIAHLSREAKEKGHEVLVFSQDKDLLQLVDKGIIVLQNRPKSDEEVKMTPDKVKEEWGITPEQMVDYLAIVGDASDNVPGVKGIGDKGAIELLKKYGTLDELYKYLHTVTPQGIQKKLTESRDNAFLSKKLVTLENVIPMQADIEECITPAKYPEEGVSLLLSYEMKTLYEKLSKKSYSGNAGLSAIDASRYELVSTNEGIDALFTRLEKSEEYTFDTETTGIDFDILEILGASFCCEEKKAWYVDLREQSLRSYFLERFRLFLKLGKKLVGQNIKYDYKVMMKYGIRLSGIHFDTMLAGMLFSGENEKVNMDFLAEKYLSYKTVHYSDIVTDKNKTLADYPIEDVKNYSCEDADITHRLFRLFERKLEEGKFGRLFYDIEMPLVTVLADMEIAGIGIDSDYFSALQTELREKLATLQKEIWKEAGEEFLINSPKQLREIMFGKLGYPVQHRTKEGASTDEQTLNELVKLGHSLPALLLEYRKYEKLRGTYVEPLITWKKKDGRIHTSFNQAFVATGRLSSTEPNLQNIPAFEEYGISIRKGFVAGIGKKLLSFDYSQIELRVLAWFSQDPTLLGSFSANEDIHTNTARLIFGKTDINDRERKIAKTINFGVIYGQSAFGLKQQLGISAAEASAFIASYFRMLPKVREYIDSYIKLCVGRGYTTTYFGRKREIPLFKSQNKTDIDAGKRIALNTRIQGTAAEIMKRAMIAIDRWQKHGLETGSLAAGSVKLLLQVHDELIFEVAEGILETVTGEIQGLMEGVMADEKWNVPLTVKYGTGDNWDVL